MSAIDKAVTVKNNLFLIVKHWPNRAALVDGKTIMTKNELQESDYLDLFIALIISLSCRLNVEFRKQECF